MSRRPAAVAVVDKVAGILAGRSDRRRFLSRAGLTATALAVAPAEFVLRPVSAYAAICGCGGMDCDCGSACCDGYTEFCCAIHDGANVCPPGTFAGGWWKADGSSYCSGARYYIDCQAECSCSGDCGGGSGFCGPGCDGLDCGCALGSCDHRRAGCVTFRYGQCHTEIACSGRIACRVVTCTPAYLVDNNCGSTTLVDEYTANHNAPCLQYPPRYIRQFGFAARTGGGEWFAGRDGGVFTFDGAPFYGSMGGHPLDAAVVGVAGTPTGKGYWLVAEDGGVFSFGDARFFGSAGGSNLYAPVVGMASTPKGDGYWLVASDGGVFTYGTAPFLGSIGGHLLDAPVVGIAASPTGKGYWMVATDGGVFSYGDAGFHGSMGGQGLSAPVIDLIPTPSGAGYWLLGQDGSVYTFGDAPFYGSYGSSTPDPALPADGVDAFYGLVPHQAPGKVIGYTLLAVAGTAAPPAVHRYSYGL